MNRIVYVAALLGLLMLGGPAYAQQASRLNYLDQLPPLIDRELFFGNPQRSNARLSPDGEQLAFIKSYNGTRNIWVKEIGAPFDTARPITADDRPVPGYFWSQDGRYLLYVQDKGGNENFHVYAVTPTAEPADEGVPMARDLTPLSGVRARIYAVPEKAPGEIIVGLNNRKPAYHDVYRIDIATGARQLVIENTQKASRYVFDREGEARLAVRQDTSGGTEILRLDDNQQLTPVYTCSYRETCSPIRFHQDSRRVYLETNKGEGVNLTRLMLLNPRTQETTVVASDPENEVDFGRALFSDKTEQLIATVYTGDRQRIYPKDETFARDLKRLNKQLPDGNLAFTSFTESMDRYTVTASSDVDPGSVYLYHRPTGDAERLYRSRPNLPSEHLAEMQTLRYTARDGREIPAYLTIPKGVEAESLAVVVHPHGGPWARDTWGYDAYAQFLANRGYAVLQPNFRGSTGYGKDFLNAGNEAWGTGPMQHDLTDGVRYLIEQGIARPDRVSIFGGSYGGYAALAGLAFTPDLYAAGVSYVGPSNLLTLLKAIPPYWKPLKKTFDLRVGNPDDPADRRRLKKQSPLFSTDQIAAPLLVIQGANDPRVKKQESDQIVVALRERGVDVQYLVAPNEGHGFRSQTNRLAVATALERFLADHLGGRYQQSTPTAIRNQLKSLQVHPSAVTLPDSLRAAFEEPPPLPRAQGQVLASNTLRYRARITMRGDSLPMDMTRVIEPAAAGTQDVWRIVETTQLPAGASVDTFEVDRNTLRPVRRSANDMGTVHLRYTKEAVQGTVSSGGRDSTISTTFSAPVFGDGPGLLLAVAGLPLKEGYETPLRQYSTEFQQVRPMHLLVTGTETVTTPAGSFDTYVVQIEPQDGNPNGAMTLRVTQEAPHHVVQATYQLSAQTDGGTMTTTLTSVADGRSG